MKFYSMLLALIVIVTAYPAKAQEQPTIPEAQYIQDLFDSTLSTFRTDVANRRNFLHQILETHFQMTEASKFIAGNSWRLANDADRAAFADAFADFLTLTALHGLEKQPNLSLSIESVKRTRADAIDVISTISLPNNILIPVNWIVETHGNRYAIRDIVFLGISMKTLLRDFIASAVNGTENNLGAYALTLRQLGSADLSRF